MSSAIVDPCDYSKLTIDDLLATANQFNIDVPIDREMIIKIFKDYQLCPGKVETPDVLITLFNIRGDPMYQTKTKTKTQSEIIDDYGFKKATPMLEEYLNQNGIQYYYRNQNYDYSLGFKKVLEVFEDFIFDHQTVLESLFNNRPIDDDIYEKVVHLVQMIDPKKDVSRELFKKINKHNYIFTLAKISREIFDYLTYMTMKHKKSNNMCMSSVLILYYKGIPMGFIFLFYDDPTSQFSSCQTLVIQSICTTIPFLIAKELFPDLKLPKLNDYFMPFIRQYAKTLGCEKIGVYPIGSKQEDILTKYYGFTPSTTISSHNYCGYGFSESLELNLDDTSEKSS
jgi:hypothetical protein